MKTKILTIIWMMLFLPLCAEAITDSEYEERLTEISPDKSPLERHKLIKALIGEVDVYKRFALLPMAAKNAFEANDYILSQKYAEELLDLAKKYPTDWNYGNAIHDGNMVLGRLAVRKGEIDRAAQFLIAAGKTPGSPQLKSFGPNMSLASDLLENGETESVIMYFDLCKQFWEMEDGRLDSWAASIRGGGKPYFGVQTFY